MRNRGNNKLSRSELLRKAKDMSSKSRQLMAEVGELKIKYKKLKDALQPQIEVLQRQADRLAIQFKKLFEESQESYQEGDGALAKVLSLQGKELQNECKDLNSQVNELRSQLSVLHTTLDSLRKKADEYRKKELQLNKEAFELRKTKIKGFENNRILSTDMIENFLDDFPQGVFKIIQSINYVENLYWKDVPSRGMAEWNTDGMAIIKIAKQPAKSDSLRAEALKEVIAHEIGHVLYVDFLGDEHKAEWYACHMDDFAKGKYISDLGLIDETEDFAESFKLYMLNRPLLLIYDKRRYNIIDKLVSGL